MVWPAQVTMDSHTPYHHILLSNASSTGAAQGWGGTRGIVTVEGTFGGATLALQYLSDNGTWIAVGSDSTFTAAGAGGFELPVGSQIRMAVTGGAPSGLYAYATEVNIGR
jgi:hypothetical protein